MSDRLITLTPVYGPERVVRLRRCDVKSAEFVRGSLVTTVKGETVLVRESVQDVIDKLNDPGRD